jgi:hypothetical protein
VKCGADTKHDKLIDGPWTIAEKFFSLATAGFDTIDAVLVVPGHPSEAYIFRGTKYVRIDVAKDRIISGPGPLSEHFPALVKTGLDSVDAALPQPGNTEGVTYFFRGDKYVKDRIVASAPDEITWGPTAIVEEWKTLEWF